MALTKTQKDELMTVLKRTGGHREIMYKTRVIPDSYKAYQSQCEQTEQTLLFPGLLPLRVIITTPHNKQPDAPLHVNYHGGGFIARQDSDDDMYCAHLAVETGAVVVDVDYAVSTEASYPMAVDQSYAAARWAFDHCAEWQCDSRRFSIGGSSAGGNLALTVALHNGMVHELPLCLLVLEYAASDLYQAVGDPAQERSDAFSRLYADGDVEKLKNPMLSPAFATEEQLRSLPPTLIIAPQKCPFYQINNELGMRMVEVGVPVTFHAYPDEAHGFTIRMTGGRWLRSQQDVIEAIRTARL